MLVFMFLAGLVIGFAVEAMFYWIFAQATMYIDDDDVKYELIFKINYDQLIRSKFFTVRVRKTGSHEKHSL